MDDFDSEGVKDDPRAAMPESAMMREGYGPAKLVKLAEKTLAEKYGHANPTHEARLKAVERAAEVYQLRLEGWTMRQLAHHFGVSASVIDKIIRRELDKVQRRATQGAEHVRGLMQDRLDAMWKALFPNIVKGNTKSVEMGLRIMERQARLDGLDAPEKRQVDLNVEISDVEIVSQAKRAGIRDIPPELLALLGESIDESLGRVGAMEAAVGVGDVIDADYVVSTIPTEEEYDASRAAPAPPEDPPSPPARKEVGDVF